jgi:hypothetical protein
MGNYFGYGGSNKNLFSFFFFLPHASLLLDLLGKCLSVGKSVNILPNSGVYWLCCMGRGQPSRQWRACLCSSCRLLVLWDIDWSREEHSSSHTHTYFTFILSLQKEPLLITHTPPSPKLKYHLSGERDGWISLSTQENWHLCKLWNPTDSPCPLLLSGDGNTGVGSVVEIVVKESCSSSLLPPLCVCVR